MSGPDRGRPSLTPERRQAIAKAISAGVPIATACEIAGIHKTTFYRAMKGSRPVERELQATIARARADAEADLVAGLRKAARNGSWRAGAWLLERQNPEAWGPIRDRRLAAKAAEDDANENPLRMVDDLDARRKPTSQG